VHKKEKTITGVIKVLITVRKTAVMMTGTTAHLKSYEQLIIIHVKENAKKMEKNIFGARKETLGTTALLQQNLEIVSATK